MRGASPLAGDGSNTTASLLRSTLSRIVVVGRVVHLVFQASPASVIVLVSCALLQSLVPIAQYHVTRYWTDLLAHGIASGNVATLDIAIAVLSQVFTSLIGILLSVVISLHLENTHTRFVPFIHRRIMERTLRTDFIDYEDPAFYDQLQLVQRESQFRPVQMIQNISLVLRSVLTLASIATIVLEIAFTESLIAMVAPLPSMGVSYVFGIKALQLNRSIISDERRSLYFLNMATSDSFAKEVRSFGISVFVRSEYLRIAQSIVQRRTSFTSRRQAAYVAGASLAPVAFGFAAVRVSLKAIHGTISLGTATAYFQSLLQAQSSVSALSQGLQGIHEASLYFNELEQFLTPTASPLYSDLSDREKMTSTRDTNDPVLSLSNVSWTYSGSLLPTLENLSLVVRSGELVVITGRSGSGKSTLIKLIAGLYEPGAGTVSIMGQSCKSMSDRQRSQLLSVMFQDYGTYHLTLRDNVALGSIDRIVSDERIHKILCAVGLEGKVRQMPFGLDTVLGKWFDEGHQLSGGEWQRLAIARTLARDVELYLFDEPTASVDPTTEEFIIDHLRNLARTKAVIVVTHRSSICEVADQVLVLDEGSLKQSNGNMVAS